MDRWMARAALAATFAIAAVVSARADPPASFAVGAAVSASVNLVANGLGTHFSTDLAGTSNRDVVVADLVLSSNSPNGFQVSFTSLNGGVLVRAGGAATRDADSLRYRVDIEPGVGGQLGTAMPSASERRNLDLSVGTETIRFSQSVVGPTLDKAFVLEIHTSAKSSLFAGTYRDTITISLDDL